jgi:hypothetical protein
LRNIVINYIEKKGKKLMIEQIYEIDGVNNNIQYFNQEEDPVDASWTSEDLPSFLKDNKILTIEDLLEKSKSSVYLHATNRELKILGPRKN